MFYYSKNIFYRKKKIINSLIPKKIYNNNIHNDCYIIKNRFLGDNNPHHLYLAKMNTEPVALIIESTAPDGFSGNINLLISSDFNGKIYGVRVIKHNETPGIGDKIDIRLSNWIEKFKNKKVLKLNDNKFSLKKDGGEFDQFTGATITPRAVIKSIKKAVVFNYSILKEIKFLKKCNNNDL